MHVAYETRCSHRRSRSDEETAFILEPDPLVRLLIVPAVSALGLRVLEGASVDDIRHALVEKPSLAPAAVFFPLNLAADCRTVSAAVRRLLAAGGAPHVIGYGRGPAALLAAHGVHGCVDAVLQLGVTDGHPRLDHLPVAPVAGLRSLTVREVDVLVLLLDGLTTAAIASALCISYHTARTHCRAVLRKLGAGDRRALRARLLAGPPSAASMSQPAAALAPTGAPAQSPSTS